MTTVEQFICETCGKTFDTQQALAGHAIAHKTKGHYPCPECAARGVERVFDYPQILGSHRAKAHGIKGTAKKNVRKRLKQGEPVRAVDVPVVVADFQPEPPSKNGDDPIGMEIRAAFAPLVVRYETLQARQLELMNEAEQVSHDLTQLWEVLGSRVEQIGPLAPPPSHSGVQVAFSKKVSDSLRMRGEEWLLSRRNSFTVTDMARGIGSAPSTAGVLVAELRDEGKLRLVGKRGHAKTYLSTIGAR